MLDYKLDLDNQDELTQMFQRVGENAERLTNEYLEQKGSKIMMQKMIEFTPVSKKKKGKHAKQSNAYKVIMGNLGFQITTRGTVGAKTGFGYLIFPEEGRGPRNLVAQLFAEKAMNDSNDELIQGLLEVLEKVHN